MTEQTSPLKTAICEFKKKDITILKDAKVSFGNTKYNYADLATILDAVEKPLAECGLTLVHKTEYLDGILVLRSNLSHKDSDEVETSILPVHGTKPQEIGSSLTYNRRYNTQSLLNLAAEDDDGQAANNAPPVKDPAAPKRALWTAINNEFKNIKDTEALEAMWVSRTDDLVVIQNFNKEGYTKLEDEYNRLKGEFSRMGV